MLILLNQIIIGTTDKKKHSSWDSINSPTPIVYINFKNNKPSLKLRDKTTTPIYIINSTFSAATWQKFIPVSAAAYYFSSCNCELYGRGIGVKTKNRAASELLQSQKLFTLSVETVITVRSSKNLFSPPCQIQDSNLGWPWGAVMVKGMHIFGKCVFAYGRKKKGSTVLFMNDPFTEGVETDSRETM